MDIFSRRNAVLLSLMQVGVVVFGILGLAASRKLFEAGGDKVPALSLFLLNYGEVLLAAPLLWIAVAMRARRAAALPDEIKTLFFFSGFAVLAALVILIGYGVAQPWLHADWGAKMREKNSVEF